MTISDGNKCMWLCAARRRSGARSHSFIGTTRVQKEAYHETEIVKQQL